MFRSYQYGRGQGRIFPYCGDALIYRVSCTQRLSFVRDSDSLDWKNLEVSEIAKRVTSKVQPGSIVLFHNSALNTPEALLRIIEYLLQEGYTFVPISEIILKGEYTIDHTGRQRPVQ